MIRTTTQISIFASAVAASKQYRADTIITFLPESPDLEANWRYILSKVRQERAAAAESWR